MGNWKHIELGSLINFRRGFDLPKTDMISGQYPVVASNGIIGYHNQYTTKAPVITIGRSGNVGTPYFYNENCWAHNTTLVIDAFYDCDPKFIYYLLKTLNLQNYRGGSAVPTLNRNHIHPIKVYVPELKEEQKAIAEVLSSFDDKIELNNKIIKNLEEQAQLFFKKNLEMRKIKVDKLNNICDTIAYGKFVGAENVDGLYPVYGAGGIKAYSGTYDYLERKLIIGCRGTCGNLTLTEKYSNISHNCLILETENIYVLYNALNLANISSVITGSTQPQITIMNLSGLEVCIFYHEKDTKNVNEELSNIYNRIYSLQIENKKLEETRDYLLPKLMNGEIKIK